MRMSSLSWLYTALLIIISFAIYDVKSVTTTSIPTTATTTPAPDTPPSVGASITKVKALNFTSLQVSWDPVSDANGAITSYTVCYSLTTYPITNCLNGMQKDVGIAFNTVITRLNAFTTYSVAVKASTAGGAGPLGPAMNGTTNQTAPEKGATVTMVKAISSKGLEVTWQKLQGSVTNGEITGYRICYSTESFSPDICPGPDPKVTVLGADNTTFNLIGLNEATLYHVGVQARTVIGFGPNDNIISGTTLEAKPAKGPNISGIIPSARSLKVTWDKLNEDDSNGEITRYQVCYALGSVVSTSNCGGENVLIGVDMTTTNITGLTPAIPYTVAVRASTKIGYSDLGRPMSVETLESAPEKGATVTMVKAISSKVLEVTWQKLQGSVTNGEINGYRICYSPGLFSSDMCPGPDPQVTFLGVDNTTFNLTGLNEATLYHVGVQAGTDAGFGPIDNIISGTTMEAKPAKGPNITNINQRAKSLKITWNKLNADDSNGRITKYQVCYALGFAVSESDCSEKNVLIGDDNTTTDITGLTPAMQYAVAVRASTKIGYGVLGDFSNTETLQSIPSAPIIDPRSINLSYTTIELMWSVPRELNGDITNYQVCWLLKNCENTTKTKYKIEDLNPGTKYAISVSAFTKIGEGPPDRVTGETLNSSLGGNSKPVVTSDLVVSDTKTQIGFELPNVVFAELYLIKRYDVIVKRWVDNDDETSFRETPQNALKDYDNSSNGMKPYIAVTREGYENGGKIIVGDNGTTVYIARRKRRNAVEYVNAPLSEDTEYAIFIRAFYNDAKTSFQSSGVLRQRTAAPKTDDGNDTLLIVIVIIVVIVFILVAIFGVLLLRRRRKPQRNYDGISLETTAKHQLKRQNVPENAVNELKGGMARIIDEDIIPQEISYIVLLKDWEIAPDKLQLLDKRLGEGKFGIVKQGLLTSETGDPELVAVKMLKGQNS